MTAKAFTVKELDNKRVIETPNESSIVKTVDIETARQMARDAAGDAVSLVEQKMGGFNKFNQEQIQESLPRETVSQDPLDDQMVFDKGAFRSVSNTMRAIKSMQDVFTPPPSKIEQAVQNVVENVSTDIATKMLSGGLGGSGGASRGLIADLMHEFLPAFGHGLGESLGANGPETVKSIISSLTGNKQLSNEPNNAGEKTNQPKNENSNAINTEKQKDQILSLDTNNPEHVKNYAVVMGLSEKAAKEILTYHQQDIIEGRKSSSSGLSNVSNNEIAQVTQVLTTLVNEMGGMKNTIINLNNEIVNLKNEKTKPSRTSEAEIPDKWRDEQAPTGSPEHRQVTLFQESIKVDVDAIKGDNLKESFFDNKQQIEEAEFVDKNIEKENKNIEKKDNKNNKNKPLEQVIDEKGDSHFETINSEDNKKKEDEVIETQQVSDVGDVDEAKPKIEQRTEQKEEQKTEVPIQHKKIIRKPVIKKEEPIKEEPVEESTKKEVTKQERYDINNNLIVEK